MPILIDAHEDLAYNMLTFGRDYTLSALETRQRESGTQIPVWSHGDTLLGWPEYQRGQVALIFGTLFAAPKRVSEGDWDRLAYRDAREANRVYHQMLDAYSRLEDHHPEYFRIVRNRADLSEILRIWNAPTVPSDPEGKPTGRQVGLVISMEGAEGVLAPAELEEWFARGVRLVGPSWVTGNSYTGGNGEPGGLTRSGVELVETMSHLGMTLDISHLDPQAASQAMDAFDGVVIASHSNPAAMFKNQKINRHLSNDLIHRVIERDGVIGIVFYNAFLKEDWTETLRNAKALVSLHDVVAHIDTVCQLAGDARHVGIGTDFDGGVGVNCTPAEVDSIADLQKLVPLLEEKGYTEEDITAIFSKNWVSILQRTLPDA
jgi:membrane dipeptidase